MLDQDIEKLSLLSIELLMKDFPKFQVINVKQNLALRCLNALAMRFNQLQRSAFYYQQYNERILKSLKACLLHTNQKQSLRRGHHQKQELSEHTQVKHNGRGIKQRQEQNASSTKKTSISKSFSVKTNMEELIHIP